MNIPNLITLSRIPLMLLIIAFLYPETESSFRWSKSFALFLFLFAALTDWLDGWLARKFGQVSDFGKFMDALADKVLTLGMFTSLLALGALPILALFPILLILSRELLITGLRLVAAGKGKTLEAEKIGKLKTVIQLTCISLSLAKLSVESDFTSILSQDSLVLTLDILDLSAASTLIVATLITVISGIIYLTKYWRFFLDEEK